MCEFFKKKNVHASWRLGIFKVEYMQHSRIFRNLHIDQTRQIVIWNRILLTADSYEMFWRYFLDMEHLLHNLPFVTTEMYAAKALMISGHIFLYCFFLCLSLTTQTDMPTASTIFHVYPYTSAEMTGKELYTIYTFFWKAACHVWCGPVTSTPSLLCITS